MGPHRVIHNSTCIIPFARNVYGYIIEVGGDINSEIIKEEQIWTPEYRVIFPKQNNIILYRDIWHFGVLLITT